MYKGKVLVFAVLLLLVLSVCSVHAEDYWMLNGQTNVYSNYDTNSSIVAVAGGGTIYTIIDSTERNRWIKIAYSDQQTGIYTEGWINESLLETPSSLYSGAPMITEHQGDSRYANENGNQGQNHGNTSTSTGIILCESMTLRSNADTYASRVATIQYGDSFEILQDDGTWLRVRCHKNNMQYEGWLLSSYVLQDPTYFTTTAETPAYAYASTTSKRVGLIDAGTQLPIIAEMEGFYVVSLRAASAFIQK